MKSEIKVDNLINLITKLSNLCEGFDFENKNVLISTKLKILININNNEKISPSILKNIVGLAKGNLALICKNLIKENLIIQTKDGFDSRMIFYEITPQGKEFLQQELGKIKNNFEKQLAYKSNFNDINSQIANLLNLID